ncbi:PAS domain S-box protein [Methanospirillum sp.]|uniref:PAS domain-containing protein n=1 Tax=Methanospirillum sp. TaxID=45200 RepID=UPI0035A1D141
MIMYDIAIQGNKAGERIKMIGNYEEIHTIKDLLHESPQGLSITEISKQLNLHRTTAAKYLDILQMKGDVDLRIMGTSKVYHLSSRVPAAVLRNFFNGPFILFTARLAVREFSSGLSDYGIIGDIFGKELTDTKLSPIYNDEMQDLCKKAVFGTPAEIEITTKNEKDQRNLNIRIIPVVFDDGRAGCAFLIHDMTDLIITKREVEICEKELKVVSEDLTEFVFRCTPDGILKKVNLAFCARMDRKPEELLGFPYEPVISCEDLERLSKAKQKITPATPSQTISFKTIQPDGMMAFEEWTYRGIFTENNTLSGYLATGHDISREKYLEEQLNTFHASFESLIKQRTKEMRQANQDLMKEFARREKIERELLIIDAAFNHASDSILLFERSGKLWHANETSCRLLGYLKDEITAISVFDINREITPEIWDKMWELSEQEPEISRVNSTHVRKDGAIIPVEVSRTFFTAGPMTLFCSIAREIQITR